MGCCVSTPGSVPYPTQEPNSSSRAITSSQPQSHTALPRPSTHASSHSNRPQHAHAPPLATHVNQPLRALIWSSKDRLWTRADLDRERTDFFFSRVTGRPEIWQTIRAALEVLWAGGDPVDNDGGIGTAQQILDAAGITRPWGVMHPGVYDASGVYYQLPKYISADPANLSTPTTAEEAPNEEAEGSGDASEELDEEELLRRREEKGKAVMNAQDLITICARLTDDGHDIFVSIGKDDSVRLINRKIFEESGRHPPKSIKVAYMGKILKDNETLAAQGWQEDHVLNALVFGCT